ncbi:DNA damage-inducible protein DinB [Polycladomyces abyssicola]|uniref:DNA damage-inducible protein DinB n=1 Tax=Polycladomyces abyssicola TaxID=1125966 RepID=A0A8D5UF99_9BACL|nr:DinB family protein [Polycladomyces abyssicola]BCU80935.1 DNA damage-inducible protein DinB [Polycladomyces abyssicola]
MYTLFRYNWQVRDEWFQLCDTLPHEELMRPRTGGLGCILRTLFHIVDVEYSWILFLQGKPDFEETFEQHATLASVKRLSESFRPEVERFLQMWSNEMETRTLQITGRSGQLSTFTHGEILRHVIAHEIHHVGQLSVWARELNLTPPSANVIGRKLMEREQGLT